VPLLFLLSQLQRGDAKVHEGTSLGRWGNA
jgi:hypothetical protein